MDSTPCRPCRIAGQLLTEWKKGEPVLIDAERDDVCVRPPKDENEFLRFLMYLHSCCKGHDFCYCQHSVSTKAVSLG